MTAPLEEAFAKATRLPDDEQDAFPRWLMDDLESERHRSRSFETSQRQLANLAREALAEDCELTGATATRRGWYTQHRQWTSISHGLVSSERQCKIDQPGSPYADASTTDNRKISR